MAMAMKTNKIAENAVNREFRKHGARAVLLTDITYIKRADGEFTYLCTIIDAYTRQVLAYALSENLYVDFVLKAVNKLMEQHSNTMSVNSKTIIHSDQGCHFTSYAFIDIVNDSELRQSMLRRANCWDNAPQESFFGHMKDEIGVCKCKTHEEICAVVENWIDYYNNERYQWDLARLSPNEFYDYVTTNYYPLSIAPPEITMKGDFVNDTE